MPRFGSLRPPLLHRSTLVLLVLVSATGARAQAPVPRTLEEHVDPLIEEKLRRVEQDAEWSSEGDVARAQAQLEGLGELWLTEPEREAETWRPFVTGDLVATRLRPEELETAFEDATVKVIQGAAAAPGGGERVRGAAGLASALAELGEPLVGGHGRWMGWKTVHYAPREGGFETRVRWTAFAETAAHCVQLDGTWRCVWSVEVDSSDPRLSELEALDYREVHGPAGGGAVFVDSSLAAFGAQGPYPDQLGRDLEHWRRRVAAGLGVSILGHQGLCVGDADGDGLEDVYVCQPGGLPNRLFLRRPDGTTREAAAELGLDLLEMTRSGLWCDFDGDGDSDLALALAGYVAVFVRGEDGRFSPVARFEAETSTSMCAADYDSDGDVDLYVCGYVTPYDDGGAPVPYHDANNGQRNFMLENLLEQGEGLRFQDATERIGLEQNNSRFSFAAAFEDYDNDGDQDLYVANDFGRNNLYRNDGGRFVDVAAEAGVEDISAGMGVSWGDYDRDGLMDLYVSNMESSAGKRIAYQRHFREGGSDASRRSYQRHARGNTLFRGGADGRFEDVSVEAAVTAGRWAWGALFCDFNLDGALDLLSPNGFVTNERSDDL